MTTPLPSPRQDPGSSRSFAAALTQATGAQTADKPYLGDYATIESLVRALLAEELDRAVDKGAGTLTDADYGQQTLAAVNRMARIFIGGDRRYTPLAGWNTAPTLPGGRTLTVAIRERLAGQVASQHLAKPWDAATALFSVAILEWRQGLDAFSRSGDEAQLQALGTELTENYTRLLLGLPADDAD